MKTTMSTVSHIQGRWQPFRAELSGESAPALALERMELALIEGTYTVLFAGKESDHGSYELSSTPDHQVITLKGERGANAGRTIPAIYQHVGDRLRICYGLDGVLPQTFATSKELPRYLVTYRRASLPDIANG
jgi:uncharacterized protein (TIGR03067 family)